MQAEFKGTFDKLGKIAQRHSYSDVFQGFLHILLNFLADGHYEKERDREMQRYSDQEKQEFNSVFFEFFQAHKRFWENDQEAKWLDVIGQFYEEITSRQKSSAMGQFFTPPGLCDMLAHMTIEDSNKQETALDCCSGSGRLILAAHAVNPYLEFTAMDKDYICAMMTAINMQMHGCLGVVYWADALALEVWKGFQIKRHPFIDLPVIVPFDVPQEEFKQQIAKINRSVQPAPTLVKDPNTGKVEKTQQLSLF